MSTTSLSVQRRNSSPGAALTAQRTTTPSKQTPPQVTDSPGNWQHPRIDEITRRQNATVFTGDNFRTVAYNVAGLVMLQFIKVLNADFGPRQLNNSQVKPYVYWAFLFLQSAALFRIGIACLPLVRPKDDLSDIPLTPAQRKLLGLAPSSAPPTPNSVYSTPPRYNRTPSIGKPSPTSSPLSANGSPVSASKANGSPYSPIASPLLQKAVGYNGRRSFSQGTQGPFNASTSSFNMSMNSSVFSEPPATPSPPGGKRVSISLNNKWLYDRSRKSSNSVWQ